MTDLPVTSPTSVVPAEPPPAPPPEPARQRYKLVLAYDGSGFHGWQKQRTPEGVWLRTVQGVVEDTVIQALQQPVRMVGASRTDAGVHALGQVAQFDAATRIPVARIADAINCRLPDDVEVLSAAVAPPHFDAIGGAKCKQYRYKIFNSRRRPLHRRAYTYHCWWELDVAQMNAAAHRLIGTHDFSSFAAAGSPRLTNVRTIFACAVERVPEDHQVHIVISGNGFLYNMVRIIAGTLVDVGRGERLPEVVDQAFVTLDRRTVGPTLPPEGLWLEWIRYE